MKLFLIPRLMIIVFLILPLTSCGQSSDLLKRADVVCGADRTDIWLPLLKNKKVALVANNSTRISGVHLVDSMVSLGVQVQVIFAPEHGFRGEAEAGAEIKDGQDPLTGIPVVSLYTGKTKPDPEDLTNIDLVVFDIQDVGVRFYTYVSTMHYVMEACAENDKPFIIMDRPNPNGFLVDGPVLDMKHRSFVGMHPIPIAHGMTLGEVAQMINGEGWLAGEKACELSVVTCENWDHLTEYVLPEKPSPNLPNQSSIYLYPSLCLFEGTVVSVGRGTPFPFQVYGHPDFDMTFEFIPEPVPGASLNPKHKSTRCYGEDLRAEGPGQILREKQIELSWLINAFNAYGAKKNFFNNYFERLAGSDDLRKQIVSGWSEEQIREAWQDGLEDFKKIRCKYLIYP